MTTTKSFDVHFLSAGHGRRRLSGGVKPERAVRGRIPRLSRLMALAIHFEALISQGGISNQAQLAGLGYVSRARVTQIMNLLHLAPDIQEQILFLPPITKGKDPYPERKIRPIAKELDWNIQRQMWREVWLKEGRF